MRIGSGTALSPARRRSAVFAAATRVPSGIGVADVDGGVGVAHRLDPQLRLQLRQLGIDPLLFDLQVVDAQCVPAFQPQRRARCPR